MSDVYEEIQNELKESETRFKENCREMEQKMKDNERKADEFDQESIKNFSAWRDYLYKYYVLILAFISGVGIFKQPPTSYDFKLILGILLALGGIIIGFLIVNLFFFLERRWMQISHYISFYNPYDLYDHPDDKGDLRKAIVLNLKKKNEENKQKIMELKKEKQKNKNEILKLNLEIKGNKSSIRLIKYLGEQFGFIERIWIYGVIVGLLSTSIGVVLIFLSIFIQ